MPSPFCTISESRGARTRVIVGVRRIYQCQMVRPDSDIASALFEALYGDCYASVHAYALRRADPDTAQGSSPTRS